MSDTDNPLSIDDLRLSLGALGARYPISNRPPVRLGRNVTFEPVLPLGGDVAVILETDQLSVDQAPTVDEDFRDWMKRLENEEQKKGIDALAWYVSFHNTGAEWGIYIPVSSLHYIASRWLKGVRTAFDNKLRIAFESLLHHESMHYAIDRNVAAWEQARGGALRMHVPVDLKPNGYIEIEEAIANAHKLREISKGNSRSTLAAIERWVRSSPAGYCDGPHYTEDERFYGGLEECVKNYLTVLWVASKMLGGNPDWIKLATQFPVDGPVDLSKCPVIIVDDQRGLGVPPTSVKYLQAITSIMETKKFQKSLGKMPQNIQDIWARKREDLKHSIPPFPEFEKLKGKLTGLFSLRLGDNHRVHLKPNFKSGTWEAIQVGAHTTMGHG